MTIHIFIILSRWILLTMRNVSDKMCSENQNTQFMCSTSFPVGDSVEKYGTTRQATNDNITWRMCFLRRITKATHTHSEYVTLIAFHGNNGYANAPQNYVTSTLPVLSQTAITSLHSTHRLVFLMESHRCSLWGTSLKTKGEHFVARSTH
jgi:hypothetical protein